MAVAGPDLSGEREGPFLERGKFADSKLFFQLSQNRADLGHPEYPVLIYQHARLCRQTWRFFQRSFEPECFQLTQRLLNTPKVVYSGVDEHLKSKKRGGGQPYPSDGKQ